MEKPCLGRCPQGAGLMEEGKSEARPGKCPHAEIHCCKKKIIKTAPCQESWTGLFFPITLLNKHLLRAYAE